MPRCPNGTRKNKKTGECEKYTKKSPSMRKTQKIGVSNKANNVNKSEKTNMPKSKLLTEEDILEIEQNLLPYKQMHPAMLKKVKQVKVTKSAIAFLLQLLLKQTPDEIRQKNDWYIFGEKSDREMMLFLAEDILSLAVNKTRDNKRKLVTVADVTYVVKLDEELNRMFL
jgi:hypothetical protein